jgi:hypothetical protein
MFLLLCSEGEDWILDVQSRKYTHNTLLHKYPENCETYEIAVKTR